MNGDAIAHVVLLAIAFVITLHGAMSAHLAQNVWKRLVGVLAALVGAAIGCAALSVGPSAIIAVAAMAIAYTGLGVALGIRSHEAYGAGETSEFDRADAQEEQVEPRS